MAVLGLSCHFSLSNKGVLDVSCIDWQLIAYGARRGKRLSISTLVEIFDVGFKVTQVILIPDVSIVKDFTLI
ncbi:hypothetical protein SAMN05421787_1177 [Virgibacillus pantothenticus]|nr:hypothetical protein SAMN05421787_1177 [Virgibacillus pantothenticus]